MSPKQAYFRDEVVPPDAIAPLVAALRLAELYTQMKAYVDDLGFKDAKFQKPLDLLERTMTATWALAGELVLHADGREFSHLDADK